MVLDGLEEVDTVAPATAPTPAPTAAACKVLVALDLAVCVFRSRVIAEPVGAPVVLAVGATSVDRWATLGAAGVGVAAVAVAGREPKKPKPLVLAGAASGVVGLTFTAVLAGVEAGAGAVAWRSALGLEGVVGVGADLAGAEGLELKEPKPLLGRLELEEEDDEDEVLEREELEELDELDFVASATVGPIARAKLSIATLNSEIRDVAMRFLF